MSKICVLIADDSVTIQKVFELAFEGEDIDIMVASDGKSALSMALNEKPDMIIADVNMPEMDGFELCQAIKKNPDTNSIPVYMLSSALDDFDEDKAKRVGASGRFEKPFRSEDMVRQVMEAINTTAGGAGPAPVQGLDDTFEDIDISLDSIMDSLDSSETGDEDMERALNSAWDNVEEKADAVPEAVQPAPPSGASVKILDLVEDVADDDYKEGDDEDLAVETLTGSETDLELAEYPATDAAIKALADEDEIIVRTTPGEHAEETEPDAVLAGADKTVFLEDDLSEEAQAMLRAIEEEEPITPAKPSATGSGRIDTSPVNPSMMEEAVERAVRSALMGMDIPAVVEAAVQSAVASAFADKAVRDSVEAAVKAVMSDMAPSLLESFRKVAGEVTLDVAETLVKQTIDQIKSSD
ncbi:MAG: response regulator [Nitrospinae bacterium]|nr:response regulator [Nitrospinota bacterium]MBF0634801.1 response regulator [Nitrospinota bacterium]